MLRRQNSLSGRWRYPSCACVNFFTPVGRISSWLLCLEYRRIVHAWPICIFKKDDRMYRAKAINASLISSDYGIHEDPSRSLLSPTCPEWSQAEQLLLLLCQCLGDEFRGHSLHKSSINMWCTDLDFFPLCEQFPGLLHNGLLWLFVEPCQSAPSFTLLMAACLNVPCSPLKLYYTLMKSLLNLLNGLSFWFDAFGENEIPTSAHFKVCILGLTVEKWHNLPAWKFLRMRKKNSTSHPKDFAHAASVLAGKNEIL